MADRCDFIRRMISKFFNTLINFRRRLVPVGPMNGPFRIIDLNVLPKRFYTNTALQSVTIRIITLIKYKIKKNKNILFKLYYK